MGHASELAEHVAKGAERPHRAHACAGHALPACAAKGSKKCVKREVAGDLWQVLGPKDTSEEFKDRRDGAR